jgi:RNA methyltransferase, TrmH family
MQLDITSPANPKIKWVQKLHKNSFRREQKVFLVEGAKEIAFAMDAGFMPHSMFICPEIYGESPPDDKTPELFTISKNCFEKIAYRSDSDGLLAVFHAKDRRLDELNFGDNPVFIILESIEKPGNLGAILRSADGAGIDGVIVTDQKTDIFNPNVIRASLGTVFTTQVVTATNDQVAEFMEKHEISLFSAALTKTAVPYTKADYATPTAIIMGTEHEGLSNFWLERSKHIIIPMHGQNDSLNVSNAAAILAYEVIRQRNDT